MPRVDAVKTCAICGRELDPSDWTKILIQDIKRYPRGNYWKQRTRCAIPQVKVCKACRYKAIAAIKSMGVKNG